MGRKSETEVLARQDDVLEMMIKGKPTREIINIIHLNYGVSKPTIERDITVGYQHLKKYIQRNVDDVIATHVSRYEKIYQAAFDAYDYKSAIAALRAAEDLLKVREQVPLVTVNNNTLNIDGLTTEQIKQLLYPKDGNIKKQR
jgi:hypothetical protein